MAKDGQTNTEKQLEHLSQSLRRFSTNRAEAKEAIEKICKLMQPASYQKKSLLQTPGKPATRLFYLVKGVVRFYFSKEDGKEANKSFAAEGTLFAGHYQTPTQAQQGQKEEPSSSWYGIQALEDCQVLVAPLKVFYELAEQDEQVGLVIGAYYKWLAEKKERRERMLLSLDAAGRYREFLNEYPDVAGRIAQYHIAAYIGVTDVALSRLRNPTA